jgi:hypothetical protein
MGLESFLGLRAMVEMGILKPVVKHAHRFHDLMEGPERVAEPGSTLVKEAVLQTVVSKPHVYPVLIYPESDQGVDRLVNPGFAVAAQDGGMHDGLHIFGQSFEKPPHADSDVVVMISEAEERPQAGEPLKQVKQLVGGKHGHHLLFYGIGSLRNWHKSAQGAALWSGQRKQPQRAPHQPFRVMRRVIAQRP